MAEQPVSSNSTHHNHVSSPTVRRSDMIRLLTNLQIEIERTIHNVPGVLLGVSFASVIQASIHLNWQIEYLKGSLIETIVRERRNSFHNGEIGERPVRPRPSHSVNNILQRSELSRPYAREPAHSTNGHLLSVGRTESTSALGPRTIRQIQHSSTSVINHNPNNTTVVRNQVVSSVQPPRRNTDNPIYYYGDIAAQLSNARSPNVTSSSNPLPISNRQPITIDVESYPEEMIDVRSSTNLGEDSAVEYQL